MSALAPPPPPACEVLPTPPPPTTAVRMSPAVTAIVAWTSAPLPPASQEPPPPAPVTSTETEVTPTGTVNEYEPGVVQLLLPPVAAAEGARAQATAMPRSVEKIELLLKTNQDEYVLKKFTDITQVMQYMLSLLNQKSDVGDIVKGQNPN